MSTLSPPQVRGAAYTSPRFVALHHDFDITCDDPELGHHVSGLFRPVVEPGRAAHRYLLSVRAPAGVGLWYDDELVCAGRSIPYAVAMLLWHVNGQVIAADSRSVRLHAGGVARAGAAVLLPGETEAGKSTLTAALVRAGLDYLSDEIIAVNPGDLSLTGFARAVSLDPGAWPTFAEVRPKLSPRLAASLPHQWQVPADVLRPGSVVRSARPHLIVAPRLQPGVPLRVEPLSATDALVTLARATFELAADADRNLRVLAELARTCPAYRVTFGDVGPAVDAVLDLDQGG